MLSCVISTVTKRSSRQQTYGFLSGLALAYLAPNFLSPTLRLAHNSKGSQPLEFMSSKKFFLQP